MDIRQYRAIKREIWQLSQEPKPADKQEAKRAAARLAGLRRQMAEIEAEIDGLQDANERNVLRMRYLLGLRWEAIAQRTYYSRATVIRIASRGEQHIAEKQKRKKVRDK